jgi:Zn-dependent M28 family amino/carboxypeptidase
MGKFTYYAPYDGELRPIPSLYVLPADGDRLINLVSSGKTSVNLVLQANVSKMGGESANVYAVLPGRSNSIVMFQSHHDSPWRSGVEDSSGTGMVLGLAEYYARLPQMDRPYTMVFLLTGGHMVGGATNKDFIARHQADLLSRTILDIVIEHIADDYLPPAAPTGNAQPHGVFLSENPVTVGLFATSIASSHISRTLLFPTSSPLGVPTDGFPYFQAGVPIVSLISGPAWLFDQEDTLDRVAKEYLSPLAGMYIDFTSRMGSTPEPLLRLNLTVFVLGLLILIASPLAALFFAYRKRKS